MINPNPGAYPQTHPFIAREESEELNGYHTGDTVSDSSDDQNLSDEELYPIPLSLPAFFLPPVTAPIPIPQVHNITEEIASFCHLIEQIVGLEEPSLLKYALKKVEQALSKRPENPCFLASKGLLLQCNWNETEAILCINKALMIDPKNPFALMYHSYLLLHDNHIKSPFYLPDDLTKAKKDIDLSLRLRSNSCLTHSLLAKICLLIRAQAKEPDDSYLLKAYSEITQALMLNQNDIYAYKMQAKYDVEANPKALFLCQNTRTKLKKLERKNNFLLRKRFGFGEESGTLTKKINEYTLQIEKHNKIIILNLRARLYMQRANFGDLENAMKDALEVLRQEPNNVNALIIKAEVKYKLTLNDDFDDSLRMVNDAFMVCPLNNQAFLLKCEILFAKGKESDLTLAILLINVVLKDNPSDRNALMLKLAIFLNDCTDESNRKASGVLKLLLSVDPDNDYVRWILLNGIVGIKEMRNLEIAANNISAKVSRMHFLIENNDILDLDLILNEAFAINKLAPDHFYTLQVIEAFLNVENKDLKDSLKNIRPE